MLNSRTRLFVAAADSSGGKPLHRPRHPFSLSYGVNLPSSLTWFLSRTSGFSPHPPVSVLVRMPIFQRLEACLVSVAFADSAGLRRHPLQLSGYAGNGFADFPPYSLRPGNSAPGPHSLLRPSFTPYRQYRNINLSSIDYAFRPRLRVRLTPGGRTFPGNPWVFGDRNSHPVFRYSCLHGHLYAVHLGSLFGFCPAYNALLPP